MVPEGGTPREGFRVIIRKLAMTSTRQGLIYQSLLGRCQFPTFLEFLSTLLSFKIDQLFTLLIPFLVFLLGSGFGFPNEPDFIQKFLSINSYFLIGMIASLLTNPITKRYVLLVPVWHFTMAILSFKIEQCFIPQIPFLIQFHPGFRHGSQLVVLLPFVVQLQF
jgi:hypothetical protein